MNPPAASPTQFAVQVPESHYRPYVYLTPQRMSSIGWQIRLMVENFPRSSVLEVGGGNGLARHLLSLEGHQVSALDIDPALKPDLLASVTEIPVAAQSYDAILCCQVLEHLPWEKAQEAMRELNRVCRLGGVISVPTVRRAMAISLHGPVRNGSRVIRGPNFSQSRMRSQQQHYWELEAGISEKKFRAALAESGFQITKEMRPSTYLFHHFFVLRKR